jgi:hypothetical protein
MLKKASLPFFNVACPHRHVGAVFAAPHIDQIWQAHENVRDFARLSVARSNRRSKEFFDNLPVSPGRACMNQIWLQARRRKASPELAIVRAAIVAHL